MAQATIELRHLLNTNFELFDFDYSFDDKQFKEELEQAVIDYYYFYEIGQETPDRFKHVFKRKWLGLIDYYNKLHNTTLLEYNPLINYSISEALEQLSNTTNKQDNNTNTTARGTTTVENTDNIEQATTSEDTRTDNLTTTTNSNEKTSDYPQQSIAGGDYLNGERITDSEATNTGTVENINTTSNDTTTTTNGTTTNEDTSGTIGRVTIEGTENSNYEKTIEGLTGTTYQELIQKERESLIRIKGMIIEELKPCFLLVH